MRFAFFVDGSNLFGALKDLQVEVDDYQAFFSYLFKLSEQQWRLSVSAQQCQTILQRVYWYQVGTMDQWDLDDPQSQTHLRKRFDENKGLKGEYLAAVGKEQAGKTQAEVFTEAWGKCFSETIQWYEGRVRALDGMKRFHHAVQNSTDLIDIIEAGHWKVNLLHKYCDEKGLDTRLAVDMVALENNYDVAVVVSGDADSIPSIDLMKRRGKHVGAVEFVKGYPPEQKGRGFSSKIKIAADFVSRVYEMDLVAKKVAKKST